MRNPPEQDQLRFEGYITAGIGRHAELIIPGRADEPNAPADWPQRLYPGSLNVRITGYPEMLVTNGLPNTVTALDSARFKPAFEIARERMRNNQLRPKPGVPRGGDAQIWRATIVTLGLPHLSCWALRRFGSGVGEQLEFVAGERLRDYGLTDGQPVAVHLLGAWR